MLEKVSQRCWRWRKLPNFGYLYFVRGVFEPQTCRCLHWWGWSQPRGKDLKIFLKVIFRNFFENVFFRKFKRSTYFFNLPESWILWNFLLNCAKLSQSRGDIHEPDVTYVVDICHFIKVPIVFAYIKSSKIKKGDAFSLSINFPEGLEINIFQNIPEKCGQAQKFSKLKVQRKEKMANFVTFWKTHAIY